MLGFAMGAELLSLLLFAQTAESLSGQFVGAMCATGVLNVNRFGFPTLLLKIALFFLRRCGCYSIGWTIGATIIRWCG
ncbi:MAG: hypothetical protein R3F36_09750 [Candidatus Competibacteraceae bacterium]